MDFFAAANQTGMLLFILAVGFALKKAGVAGDETKRQLSMLVTMPLQAGLIISTMTGLGTGLSSKDIVAVMGISLAFYAVLFAMAAIAPVIVRAPKNDRPVYMFMSVFGNVAFMGYPVLRAVLGEQSVYYATLINVIFFLLMFTYGVAVMSGGTAKFSAKKFINLPTACMMFSVALLLLDIKLPKLFADSFASLGGAVVPLNMLVIGVSLGGLELKTVFGHWRPYAMSALKLIVTPVALWLILRLFVRDALLINTAVLLAAMPIASISTMFAIQYDRNEQAATSSVFVSTILSAFTIPLLTLVIG
jgi:predicted permease